MADEALKAVDKLERQVEFLQQQVDKLAGPGWLVRNLRVEVREGTRYREISSGAGHHTPRFRVLLADPLLVSQSEAEPESLSPLGFLSQCAFGSGTLQLLDRVRYQDKWYIVVGYDRAGAKLPDTVFACPAGSVLMVPERDWIRMVKEHQARSKPQLDLVDLKAQLKQQARRWRQRPVP
jgi:hypothetical protein